MTCQAHVRTEPVDAGDLEGVGGAATAVTWLEHRAPLTGANEELRILLGLLFDGTKEGRC